MLKNAYFLAKFRADVAENEQHFAEILPTDALWRPLFIRLSQVASDCPPAHQSPLAARGAPRAAAHGADGNVMDGHVQKENGKRSKC